MIGSSILSFKVNVVGIIKSVHPIQSNSINSRELSLKLLINQYKIINQATHCYRWSLTYQQNIHLQEISDIKY